MTFVKTFETFVVKFLNLTTKDSKVFTKDTNKDLNINVYFLGLTVRSSCLLRILSMLFNF